MALRERQLALGAQLAPDGIPLHYGDIQSEVTAGLHHAILLDRSHEGRLHMIGEDALTLLNRISTNKLNDLALGETRATILTTPTARIIDRIEVTRCAGYVLVLTAPPRRESTQDTLRRNIFYNDQVQITDMTDTTSAFALHGQATEAILRQLQAHPIEGTQIIRRKPLVHTHALIIGQRSAAPDLHEQLLTAGHPYGLQLAGSLAYNILRIRAGTPSLPELTDTYIPLELGLWDEVSFHKGCYTGQEIIARMDSRERLTRVLVRLALDAFVPAPAPLSMGETPVGTMTSSVLAPDGSIYAMGVIKLSAAQSGSVLTANHQRVTVKGILGQQPAWVTA